VLWWKNEQPEVYSKIKKFIQPTTYVAGRLTGLKSEQAYIDYTHLHFSGFGDVLNKKWSDKLLGMFGVEKEKMPEIVEPWRVVGTLTKEAAGVSSLISGIPVVAGCGDQAATSLGAGVTSRGIIFDVSGSASVFSCCVDKFNPDVKNKTLVYSRSVLPDLWTPLAYISGGGLCLKWLRDQLTWNGNQPSFSELDQEAANVAPGSEGLFFIPHFGGRTCPNNPDTRGSWIGLNWVHSRSHMYRSIMEAIAYEYSLYLKIIKELTGETKFSNVIAIGGGSKSFIFNSIKADVLGIPYATLKKGDTATRGSAVLAGYGTKIYSDFSNTVANMVEKQNEIQSNLKNHKIYKKYTEFHNDLYGSMENVFKKAGELIK
jgi:xylulokinase